LNRRYFIKKAILWISGLISALALTALSSLYPAGIRRKQLRFFPVLPLEDAPRRGVRNIRVPRIIGTRKVEERAFLVAHKGELFALSSQCTHLGCSVNWDTNRAEFLCPCHGGRYDITGRRIAGPPPAPLRKLPLKVENGSILVGVMVPPLPEGVEPTEGPQPTDGSESPLEKQPPVKQRPTEVKPS